MPTVHVLISKRCRLTSNEIKHSYVSFRYKVNASSANFFHVIQQFKDLYTIDMSEVYNITVSFGENIVKFKISDRYLFRGDLFIEKST